MANSLPPLTDTRLTTKENIMDCFASLTKSNDVNWYRMMNDRASIIDPTNPNAATIVYHFGIKQERASLETLNIINAKLHADDIHIISIDPDGVHFEATWNYVE